MVYDELTDIAFEGHVWERPGEIVVQNSCALVCKCCKTKNIPDRAVVVLDEDCRAMVERSGLD